MIKYKTILSTTLLEIIFTIILILFLVFVRQQALDYIEEIQTYSQDINLISQEITQNNLSPEQRYELDQKITSFDRILNKALILLQLVLPSVILIASIIFFYIIWHLTNKIPFKRFLAYAIVPAVLLLAAVFFSINYIAYSYFFVEKNPLPYLIASLVLLIITYYTSLFGLSTKKPFKSMLSLSLRKLPKILPFYILLLITNIIYLIFIFYIFFLTFAKANIIIPSMIILIVIILMNLQRFHIVNKISS